MSRLKNRPRSQVIDKLDKLSKAFLIHVDRSTKHALIQARDMMQIVEDDATTDILLAKLSSLEIQNADLKRRLNIYIDQSEANIRQRERIEELETRLEEEIDMYENMLKDKDDKCLK